jgi:hypothetical protein
LWLRATWRGRRLRCRSVGTGSQAAGARIERIDGSALEVEQFLATNDEPTVALLGAPVK